MGFVEAVEAGLLHPTTLAATSTGVLALAGIYMGRTRNSQKQTRAAVEEVKHAVQNDHGTHLRDDIDDMAANIRTVIAALEAQDRTLRETRQSLGGIRDDIRLERTDRMQDVQALRRVLEHLATQKESR